MFTFVISTIYVILGILIGFSLYRLVRSIYRYIRYKKGYDMSYCTTFLGGEWPCIKKT